MRVRELMTRSVATVRPTDRLHHAARLMRGRGCGCLAVVDDESKVVGVLTDRDVCMAALDAGRPLSEIDVRSAMSPRVFHCRVDETIAEAERVMGLHQVRRLPVLDADGSLQGILSLDDIALEARRSQDLIVPPVSAASVGKTLGEIDRPHLIEHERA